MCLPVTSSSSSSLCKLWQLYTCTLLHSLVKTSHIIAEVHSALHCTPKCTKVHQTDHCTGLKHTTTTAPPCSTWPGMTSRYITPWHNTEHKFHTATQRSTWVSHRNTTFHMSFTQKHDVPHEFHTTTYLQHGTTVSHIAPTFCDMENYGKQLFPTGKIIETSMWFNLFMYQNYLISKNYN